MHLRTAKTDDLSKLLEFEQGIIQAERPFDPTLAPDPISYYDLGELIKSDDAHVVIALKEEEIIGSGYGKVKDAKPYLDHKTYAYVGFMYTKPEFRGKGIAKMILDELTTWAKTKGLNEIRLEVYDENESAIKAYEKSGFSKNMVEMRKRI